jgi:polyhydroxybutyrate depolymerase
VIVDTDGFNLYDRALENTSRKWLDLEALCHARRMRVRCLALAAAIAIAPNPAAADETSTVAGSLDFGGAHRSYLIHVPPKVAARVPLVLSFHGHFGTGEDIEKLTHLDALSDELGFVVVYPDGIAGSWNDGRPQDLGADDVGFVRALIADLSRRYPIDRKRVYATGFSNGASFTQYLGCNLADEIAAIAPVSGYLPRAVVDTCHPARPISVLQIGGTSDPVEPFGGGEVKIGVIDRGAVLSAQESVDFWKANATCSGAPATVAVSPAPPLDGTSIVSTTYGGCTGGTSVQLDMVFGGGHTWPGGRQYLPAAVIGPASTQLDASRAIVTFFLAHPMQ